MKFTVNAGDFDSALKSVQGRARISTTIPILKHILVTASEAKVSVLGNDLDSSSFASLDAEVALPGSWAIPAEPLVRIAGSFPKAAYIVIEFDKAKQQVAVKSGRSRYTIPVMPAVDFPDALSAKGGFTFEVTEADLEQLFSRPAGVTDKKRVQLSGVYLHADAGKLHSCATNGTSLLRFGSQIDGSGLGDSVSPDHHGVIVPCSSLPEMVKIGAGSISVTARTIEIVSGARSYCSKLIDATFPDYQRVIPALAADHFAVDREALIECLSRIGSLEGYSECGVIDASFGNDEITIVLSGLASGAEVIECDTSGTEGQFCLQTAHLLNACKTLSGDKIDIFVSDPGSPIRIVDPSEPGAICIEMPCRSRNAAGAVAA
jgi:DNA polymerase III subunit beta